ncbi:hypothetical protein KJ359_011930 [Pestalotiopsis sp. 9143b]|nr:hypothetical protein KJ359_011930 [Pestalotiopsis sp. 9143b]
MRTKTIKVGRSIIGKIKYFDEPMTSTPSTQDCPPRARLPPVPRIRNMPEVSRVARGAQSLTSLRQFQAGRPVVNESIDEWRSRAVPRPRAARTPEPRRDERREEIRRDRDVQMSGTSSRGSSRGVSPLNRERTHISLHRGTEALYMSSIIREFEQTSLSESEDEMSAPSYEGTDNYFPNPKITFFMDRPTNLVCSVCQDTPLKMSTSAHAHGCEDDTVILPCAHAFCRGCLDTWMDAHKNCPLCRLQLTRKCGHAVEPRVISRETILSLPPTVPEGGKIGISCWECRQHGQAKKLSQLAKQFRLCRRVLERCIEELEYGYGTMEAQMMVEKAQLAHDKAREELEQFSKNTTYENALHIHSKW